MGARWRRDGRLVCAAVTEPEAGDLDIDDQLLYDLSLVFGLVVADVDHTKTALWFWLPAHAGIATYEPPLASLT